LKSATPVILQAIFTSSLGWTGQLKNKAHSDPPGAVPCTSGIPPIAAVSLGDGGWQPGAPSLAEGVGDDAWGDPFVVGDEVHAASRMMSSEQ